MNDMDEAILIREWDPGAFHAHVLRLETSGYIARRETYQITPEMNPETGEIIHLYEIEMFLPAAVADA
jgi:hypothetical protein